MFRVSNADFDSKDEATIKWDNYTANFNVADVVTVDNPTAMVDALEGTTNAG